MLREREGCMGVGDLFADERWTERIVRFNILYGGRCERAVNVI